VSTVEDDHDADAPVVLFPGFNKGQPVLALWTPVPGRSMVFGCLEAESPVENDHGADYWDMGPPHEHDHDASRGSPDLILPPEVCDPNKESALSIPASSLTAQTTAPLAPSPPSTPPRISVFRLARPTPVDPKPLTEAEFDVLELIFDFDSYYEEGTGIGDNAPLVVADAVDDA
jgi:hypothetical protein